MSAGGAVPPGWYPDPWGQAPARWFDGAQWTAHISPTAHRVAGAGEDPTGWVIAAHLTALFTWVIGPLVIWLIKREEMPEVDRAGVASINWQLSWAIYMVVLVLLIVGGLVGAEATGGATVALFFLGFMGMIAVSLLDLVFIVIASVKGGQGESWRYPLALPLLRARS